MGQEKDHIGVNMKSMDKMEQLPERREPMSDRCSDGNTQDQHRVKWHNIFINIGLLLIFVPIFGAGFIFLYYELMRNHNIIIRVLLTILLAIVVGLIALSIKDYFDKTKNTVDRNFNRRLLADRIIGTLMSAVSIILIGMLTIYSVKLTNCSGSDCSGGAVIAFLILPTLVIGAIAFALVEKTIKMTKIAKPVKPKSYKK